VVAEEQGTLLLGALVEEPFMDYQPFDTGCEISFYVLQIGKEKGSMPRNCFFVHLERTEPNLVLPHYCTSILVLPQAKCFFQYVQGFGWMGIFYQAFAQNETSQKIFTSWEDSFSFLFCFKIQEKLSGD